MHLQLFLVVSIFTWLQACWLNVTWYSICVLYYRRQLWVVTIFDRCLQHTEVMHMLDWLESCPSIDLVAAFLVLSSGEASRVLTWMCRCWDWNCILETSLIWYWVVTLKTLHISQLPLYLLRALIDLHNFDVAFRISRIV